MKTWKKPIFRTSKKSFVALALLSFIVFLPSQMKVLQAQEIVTFPSAPAPISPFKLKKAKASGIILPPKAGIRLIGHLFRPNANERRPAVIILVSGDGLQPSHLDWAKLLADWGYVALVIDSFRSRGGTESRDTPSVGMPADAMNGARYLMSLDFVNSSKIGLIGFSMGGSRLFSILAKTGENKSNEGTFKSGVAFYPNCVADMALQVPLLVFAGDKDDIVSLSSCKTAFEKAPKYENNISFIVYSGATHFFDNPNYRKDIVLVSKKASPPVYFSTNHYDQAAHEDSIIRVRGFLKKHIGQ
ncbi:MAG: dienelactone hydrolase family protein [Sneathiella sp.]|nr:dienelactone hydrolase family protein [Sneathiella sp.]